MLTNLSDSVIAIFQPTRYKTNDKVYDVSRFIDPETGADYFRKLLVLKNTYGEDNIGIGMGFMGATGIFKELPKTKDYKEMSDIKKTELYNSLFKQSYFL